MREGPVIGIIKLTKKYLSIQFHGKKTRKQVNSNKGTYLSDMSEQWSMALSFTDVDQISDAMVDSYFTSKNFMSWGGNTPEDVLMGIVFGLTDPGIGWNSVNSQINY